MKKLIDKFVTLYIKPIISWCINAGIWALNIRKRWEILDVLEYTAASVNDLSDVQKFLKNFRYKKEPFDWTPWPSTMVLRDYADDCDGAAAWGKWLKANLEIITAHIRVTCIWKL